MFHKWHKSLLTRNLKDFHWNGKKKKRCLEMLPDFTA